MSSRVSFTCISFVLILVSFVFLLLATISTPVVSTFNLGKSASHTYGLFGYCWNEDNNYRCSGISYPIQLGQVDDPSSNWTMSSNSRDTLAKIFVITPIALGFNFFTLVTIFTSLFIGKKGVLVAIGLNVIAAILSVISCIVTILAFYPNLAWTSWILIGSAAANLVSVIFLIITLTVISNETDEIEDSDDEGLGFGRINNYDKLDDKFNHIQTSTFKSPNSSSSIENDYDYKPYNNNNNNNNSSSNSNSNRGNMSYNRLNQSGPSAIAAANAASKNYSNASLINNGYAHRAPGGGVPTAGNGSLTSASSYHIPQSANDFTQRQNSNGNLSDQPLVSGNGYKPVTTSRSISPPYPSTNGDPSIANANPNGAFSRSVFEHHPQVEGHKPFTELDDDYDDEEDLGTRNIVVTTNNDSDEDSDFTSVSQRAPNPQYNGNNGYNPNGYYQQQQQQLPRSQPLPQHHHLQQQQQYQLMNQQMFGQPAGGPPAQYPTYNNSNGYFAQNSNSSPPQQQRYMQAGRTGAGAGAGAAANQQRPTVSDNIMSSNPELNFNRGGAMAQKRKISPGFVPVAARYNTLNINNPASSLMGRDGTSAGQARNGPYGMTRP
ncbi:uncharacterized protein LODBEIA_P44490 [Lodderomyces beijingensis]|uniref:PH-response regulator protein palI/RIM9 n=1 Tax=Lodderomyces beijingensis TaxID=1775926 RepID=A0ABP0ZPZ7_9ASCO